jgi:hypothetical protein
MITICAALPIAHERTPAGCGVCHGKGEIERYGVGKDAGRVWRVSRQGRDRAAWRGQGRLPAMHASGRGGVAVGSA